MSKSINRLILGLALGVLGILLPVVAQAQSLDYTALKYGTSQTSMASGYFVHPAQVTVKNHAYVVTMDIKTAKKLTSWPVTVLAVDGHAPENVRKTKDGAGNSHLYYSFTTTNLKRKVNAKLAIDVPDVYKAKHLITFKFKTAHLPALTTAKTATTAAKTTTSEPAARHSQSSATPKAASSSQTPATSSPSKASTHHRHQASRAASSTSRTSQSTPTSSSRSQSTTMVADQVPQQKTHWGGLIGGAVAIIVLVGGGSWWYFGRH
ncbi:NEAT domain-containing protein [Levilactobacillus suantsaiihabitans]|uniref:Cell surface protein n=1 Tax=Levilactobacillus suantsaiihabitans TaxID=2487722 RepID=A0A4Z0JD56_9LACO|nr:NEAT domain-containing protein [Levilactobacillus suantsaiihabitans]TGD19570.1 cell surface protein [Levilactobacillus suantsaiihabitans]